MSKRKKTEAVAVALGTSRVDIHYNNPGARQIYIAGSFNEWHTATLPMIDLGGGRWVKELTLPPGRYEYRFIVDGLWADDPTAKETVANAFGGLNAVLRVQPGS